MSLIVEKVRQEIIAAIKSDRLVLPTLPEVALRVREVADDPKADLEKLTQVIGNDAALSARIVRVANTPPPESEPPDRGPESSCHAAGHRLHQ